MISSLIIASISIAVNMKNENARANTFLKEAALKQSHSVVFNESFLYTEFSLTHHVIATHSVKHHEEMFMLV